MINLLRSELLKLKRSMMVRVAFAGVSVTPIITFLAYVLYRDDNLSLEYSFADLLSETSFYFVILIGTPLFGVLAAWLFNREFSENTLKDILAIPVSRSALIVSKLALFLFSILVLSLWSCLLGCILAFIGNLPGGSLSVIARYFAIFALDGWYLFLLSTPIVFATLLFRDYVPVIIFTVCITLVSVMVSNSEYQAFYPWTAILSVVMKESRPPCSAIIPYASIYGTSLVSFVASLIFFERMDIT
jgi:bacitracin transport system permease protein